VTQHAAAEHIRRYADKSKDQPGSQWHWMVSQGHKVGPCPPVMLTQQAHGQSHGRPQYHLP